MERNSCMGGRESFWGWGGGFELVEGVDADVVEWNAWWSGVRYTLGAMSCSVLG